MTAKEINVLRGKIKTTLKKDFFLKQMLKICDALIASYMWIQQSAPASVAQFDVRPTVDREVRVQPGWQHIFVEI